MNKMKTFFAMLVALAASVSAVARADNNGFYVVGSVGRTDIGVTPSTIVSVDPTTGNFIFSNANARGFQTNYTVTNDHDMGYQAQLGYRSGNIGVEGGYTDLGKSSFESFTSVGTVTGDFRAGAANLDVVGFLPLGHNFEILGKIGEYYWQSKADLPLATGSNTTLGTTTINDSGWNMDFGAGIQYHFNDYFGLRAQFERYNGVGNSNTTGDSKVNFVSAGAVLKF